MSNIPSFPIESNTKVKFDVDVSIPTASGHCKFFCGRSVKEAPVVHKIDSFVLADRGSNTEDQKAATLLVYEEILRRCRNDDDKCRIVCRAIKLDPTHAASIKVKQIQKLKFILGE